MVRYNNRVIEKDRERQQHREDEEEIPIMNKAKVLLYEDMAEEGKAVLREKA